jgi:hypothetical protein
MGRSGSTLAERLLGQVPGMWPAGELAHMWQRGIVASERCGCGEPFACCPFWRKVGEAGFGGWEQVDVGRVAELRRRVDRTRFVPLLAAPALMRPAFRQMLDEYLTYYARLYAGIEEVSGCQTVIDSSKHASLAFCLAHLRQLDLRVVHVVRDSRAVAYSWTKQVSRPDAKLESYMRTYSPTVAAAMWGAQNSAMHLLARTGTPILRLRYEDLASAPEAALRKIITFAGLPAARLGLGFLRSDSTGNWADFGASHTASGNPMRFTTGEIPIREDDSWRDGMPGRSRALVAALTFPWLARYGYLKASDPGS